ncbi:regulator of G-protein signaling 17 [Poecilia latipinna]|uniref:Regulator of G protein signaling 17 n=4 Tax=Poecilia TaxID=8080 RepID=A0A087XHY3_POEFO|nr:PREDICTED: regulator of G-protein signaling 17-like [Poecilia formosa]XP_008427412.1 PREDICTED: regulator of G-protein signaling 17-like [Poecilia reticulata]XP_008427413.1 PREDICTED: regulator of G-protein signaling 17-like [Poecilia reticulata]XP_008427415.1 PREDICTED: regulator of G-protein signaling 17-like [Poecilia reticulata]XP_014862979.1 PREDICTED: regulator of G-protein signaling 17-like [Poecilia mexicana]XP_014862980.1 PREDICTED: regulator of G-protein signaling 17-like [Poecili
MPHSVSGVEMRKRQAAHIEAPPQAPGQPRPNTCCLCWCGCCKCLWNEDRIERSERQTCTKMDSIEAAEEQRPSLEELLSWARSFEMMLRSLEGREIFRDFLRSEYSEDNLLFWLACEELKKETNPSAVDEKARIIYEDYVSILSPKEVSLDSRVREGINQSLTEPSNTMYEEAQLQIYTLMHRDSFPRFLNSSVYRDLLDSRRRTCLDT